MKISVFGLGYVGCVSAACLAKEGHVVIGVDVNPIKVDMINQGKSPIVEKDIDKIISETAKPERNKPARLKATTDPIRAILDTDISLICVGTPTSDNGNVKLDYIKRCAANIGEGLRQKENYHLVVVRSTIPSGTLEKVIIKEIIYVSGKKIGRDFGAVMNPEFLRESTSVYDFYHPPVTVIGEFDKKSGEVLKNMYHFLDAPFVKTDIKTAEMVKYVNNSFHALKVSFANEIGSICKAMGIDSHQVMNIFFMDNKLNLSSYYLKPGFAFGGSCLPKDLRSLNYKAKELDIVAPVLRSIIESNRIHIERVINKIIRTGKKKIGLLGLSFKAETDDLRESPLVYLAETLIGKGFDIKIYDKNVSVAQLFGANKEYIEKEIPHISTLITTKLNDVISYSEVIIIGNKAKEFVQVLKQSSKQKIIFDLIRITDNIEDVPAGYNGICW